MTNIEDHEDADGNIDWQSYHQAKIENGEICYKCGNFMFGKTNRRRQCISCTNLYNQTGKVFHEKYIRCPRCKHKFDPSECDMYEVFAEEDHDIYCDECGYAFTIKTIVSYTFESPELVEDNNEEDSIDDPGAEHHIDVRM